MARFSAAHTQSLVLAEEASKLHQVIRRQVREGASNQGDKELQRTAHNVSKALRSIAEAVSLAGEQVQTLAWDQTGDVSKASLVEVAEQLRAVANLLPPRTS